MMKLKEFMSDDVITEISDDLNPKYMFQTMHTSLLVKIVSGQINAKKLARKELDNRYLDDQGNWQRKK